MQLATEGRVDDLRADLRARCFKSDGGLYYFTKVVLGYKELVPHFHLDFCNHIQQTISHRKRGYLRPRGTFKSTIISKSYTVYRLIGGGSAIVDDIRKLGDELNDQGFPQKLTTFYQTYPEVDPRNMRIMIIGESDTVAQKNLRDPKWHLLNNQLLRWLFPEIIPPNINDTKWTDDEILLPRSKSFDESTITCDGVGAKRTGFHWDIIVYDDPIGEKAARSEAIMQEAIDWFQVAPGMLHDPLKSEELYAGTRWKDGRADLPGWIMSQIPEELGRSEGFTWVVRDIYNDDGSIGFPERFTPEVLAGILKREGVYKFNCQYRNQPTPKEGGDFVAADLRYFHVEADVTTGDKVWLVPDDGSPKVSLRHLIRISFLDPTSGGLNAESENALVGIGCDHLKRIFLLSCKLKNCTMGDAVELWYQLHDAFAFHYNYFEAVGAHKEVGDIIAKRQSWGECLLCKAKGRDAVKHRRLKAEGVVPSGGRGGLAKDDRIRDYLQVPVEEHRVYLMHNYEQAQLQVQITSFPNYHLKDGADALAYAVHYAQFPPAPEEAEARTREDTAIKDGRHSRIATKYEYGGYA